MQTEKNKVKQSAGFAGMDDAQKVWNKRIKNESKEEVVTTKRLKEVCINVR